MIGTGRTAGAAVLLAAVLGLWGCRLRESNLREARGSDTLSRAYVGSRACAACHAGAYQAWKGSHHDRAMQPADSVSVLGDFNNAVFTLHGKTTRFFKKDGGYFAHTEGPDGGVEDFQIAYTFGVHPLQQYLVRFPQGRMQALTVAWDDEAKKWYSLYPSDTIPPHDWLHWTRGAQNWNTACADCHSTRLIKNFDPIGKEYKTTWSEISVGCEACHGPGAGHMRWAQAGKSGKRAPGGDAGNGFGLRAGFAKADPDREIAACARCHSLRQRLTAEDSGGQLLDHLLPELLRPGSYHADGQILGEDYEHGSFLQSKMYRKGVRCSDCHEPHGLGLRAEGNNLCTRCHLPSAFDTPKHFHHPEGSPGSLCVNCHMPGKTYMGVDFRRDHSLRIPRPDLTWKIGTPNACNGCHQDKTPEWADGRVAQWFGPHRRFHFGEILADARAGKSGAENALAAHVEDSALPAIVRATLLDFMGRYGDAATGAALQKGLQDRDPLVRHASLDGLAARPEVEGLLQAIPLLRDPVRAVRIAAASALLAAPPDILNRASPGDLEAARREYRLSLDLDADSPNGRFNLGVYHEKLGEDRQSLEQYREALALDSQFTPARVNLANLLHWLGNASEAEFHFREEIRIHPEFGQGHYSLGLLLSEKGMLDEGVIHLEKALALLPDNARIAYNLGLAYQRTGHPEKAIRALQRAAALSPDTPDYLFALALAQMQEGLWPQAMVHANRLARLQPGQAAPLNLIRMIEEKRKPGHSL